MKYIYGIVESNTEKSFGPCLPADPSSEALAKEEVSARVSGITTNEEVYAISYQDISAVVSDSQFVDFTTFPKDQVARYLLRHQRVIEKIVDAYTIIPMRLGTYALNKEEVEEILSKGYKTFNDIFKKVVNKIEVDVAATWSDFSSILRKVSEEGEIKEFKQTILNKKEGITVDDQMKIGAMIKNHLNKKREKYALEIQISLNKISEDIKVHELMDDRMVINIAFLISKDRQKDFDRKVEELNTTFAEKLNFRCVGPLPPYSFYTVDVLKIPFGEINWAREKLGLGNMATKEEIIKAYRGKAKLYHPDKNIGASDAERQFNEIFRAYKILLEYRQGGACSFDRKEFGQDAIIVKVKE